MNQMTTLTPPSEAAQNMIINARDEFGSRNDISVGAVALAEWLVEHAAEQRTDGLLMFLGGATSTRRMIADVIMPGEEWGAEMERFTDGKVSANLWRRRFTIDLPSGFEIDVAPLAQEIVSGPLEPTGLLAEIVGRLGERVPGPLFVAVRDPLAPSAFVLTGMGLAFRVDAPLANAMRAALADGLQQIGAGTGE